MRFFITLQIVAVIVFILRIQILFVCSVLSSKAIGPVLLLVEVLMSWKP